MNNNIPFLLRCSSHKAFREADLDTGFIPRFQAELFAPTVIEKDDYSGHIFGALVTMLHRVNLDAANTDSPFSKTFKEFSLFFSLSLIFFFFFFFLLKGF